MRNVKKRLLSCMLVLLMIVSLVPASIFAAEEETMSDEFKAILNKDGKFVMNTVKPTSEDEAYWFFNETDYMMEKYPDFRFDSFSDDYSSCEIFYKYDWSTEEAQESHVVEIVYSFDESVKDMVDEIVESLPEGKEIEDEWGTYYEPYYFQVKDMELVNWWVNSGEINTLIDYSSELKEYLNYKNFMIDCRMGMDADFYTSAAGYAPFMYGGSMYANIQMGVKAQHVIYIPDEIGDNPLELRAAAQNRIDEYIGKGKAQVTGWGEGILDVLISHYDEDIKEYEDEVETYQDELDELNAQIKANNETIEELQAKCNELNAKLADSYNNYNTVSDMVTQYENDIAMYEGKISNIEWQIQDKQLYINSNNEVISSHYEQISILEEQIKATEDQNAIAQYKKDIVDYNEKIQQYTSDNGVLEADIAAFEKQKSDYMKLKTECVSGKEEQMAAADKYNEEIAAYSQEISDYTVEMDECMWSNQENEGLKGVAQHNLDMAKQWKESAEQSKQWEMNQYNNEDGGYYFLQDAAGDCYFILTIGDTEHKFIIIKDSDKMITPQYKSSDVATDVTVSSDDTSIPLDTTINVDKLTSGEEYQKIMDILKVDKNETFDIRLFSNSLDNYITKLANGKFQVKIPVGATWKDKSLVVYYVDESLKIHEYEVNIADGYAAFETDHFSIYTLAEKSVAPDVDEPKIEVNEGVAEVPKEIVEEAITNAGTSDIVTLPLEDVADEVTSVQIPVASLEAVADAEKALTIETSKATVTLDEKALEKIVAEAGEEASIVLVIDEIKEDTLTSKQKEAIQDKEVEMVLSAEILCNDKLISDFGDGKVKVMIPFTLPEGANGSDYKVIYIDDDGKTEDIATDYRDGYIVVELEHFSEYAIVKAVTTGNGNGNVATGDNSNMWLWFGLLGVSAVAIGGMTVISKRKGYIGR